MRHEHFLKSIREQCLGRSMTFVEWLLFAIAAILPSARRYRLLEDRLMRTLWRSRLLKECLDYLQYRTETALLAGLLDGHQALQRFIGQTRLLLEARMLPTPVMTAHIEIDCFGRIAETIADEIDECLRGVALILRNGCDESDILWSDGNNGKFSIVMTGLDRYGCETTLLELQRRIREDVNLLDAGITVSIGAYHAYVSPNEDLKEVFHALNEGALGAMCGARKQGQRGFAFTTAPN